MIIDHFKVITTKVRLLPSKYAKKLIFLVHFLSISCYPFVQFVCLFFFSFFLVLFVVYQFVCSRIYYIYKYIHHLYWQNVNIFYIIFYIFNIVHILTFCWDNWQIKIKVWLNQQSNFLYDYLMTIVHCDNWFDYWGKGTPVTVTTGKNYSSFLRYSLCEFFFVILMQFSWIH